LIWHSAKRCRV